MQASCDIDETSDRDASSARPLVEHFSRADRSDGTVEATLGSSTCAARRHPGRISPQRIGWPFPHISAKLVGVAGLIWLAFLGIGFYALAREEFTPVEASVSTAKFPSASALALAPDTPTLILFAHPHCPCTRATLRELDGLLSALPHRVAATIVFTLPNGVPPGWEQGDQWQSAAKIPGVHIITDQDGREAKRFGVKGSGHVLLYESSGDLVFSGGITPSRGHEGDNLGRSAVIDLVNSGHAVVQRTPVYGCPLLEPPPATL